MTDLSESFSRFGLKKHTLFSAESEKRTKKYAKGVGKNLIIKGKINFLATFLYEILQFTIKVLPLHSENGRFRSSVGLEQRPSKAWVLGSNPNGITWGGLEASLFCI